MNDNFRLRYGFSLIIIIDLCTLYISITPILILGISLIVYDYYLSMNNFNLIEKIMFLLIIINLLLMTYKCIK